MSPVAKRLDDDIDSHIVAGGCCSVLQGVAVGVPVCCSVLQCVAVCCSVLQCVAVRCSVLQCVAVRRNALQYMNTSILIWSHVTHMNE